MNKSSRWYVTVFVAAASVAIALWPGAASLLEFDRAALAAGDWWRMLSGQLTHFGFEHLAWDVSVFAVLGVMCERRNRTATLACLGIAALLITAAVWLLLPEMATYRGLSGLDTALFALLGGMMLSEKRREGSCGWVAVIFVLLLGMVAKIAWEFLSGGTIFVDSSSSQFVPVPLAHLVGAAVGLLVATHGVSSVRAPRAPHGAIQWLETPASKKSVIVSGRPCSTAPQPASTDRQFHHREGPWPVAGLSSMLGLLSPTVGVPEPSIETVALAHPHPARLPANPVTSSVPRCD